MDNIMDYCAYSVKHNSPFTVTKPLKIEQLKNIDIELLLFRRVDVDTRL
jgi:hypothetical protein